ncbi:hypothetical protein [Mucilaginibacter sp.]|uniref:glucosamine inositolphosphorylceramide transferase family protein n=1 Tax=Mucilaginibacter sp. TaxID=1882438 RepID=UPI0026329F76|nr:hypothetical protein [Mucilaginibacter sp.]MDB4925247.1 hypothetical protein [Mucilaginibacter sp.]
MKSLKTFIGLFNKLFAYDKWNIGYLSQTPEDFIRSGKLVDKITWLPEDKVDYAADPFPVLINGRMHLYYEELDFWKGKGELMMLDSMSFKSKKKISALYNYRVHLSYPYVFSIKNKTYCIPESAEANEVVLYEMDNNEPQKLKKLNVLLKGRAFVDSSIIYHNKNYWLFTSKSKKNDLLYIFYADSLSGRFKAHEQNPIKVTSNMSRSAGRLFFANKKLYMPSQNHQKCYGGSVVINEITLLDETEFKYQPVFELLPQSPYNQGLHTINFCNGLLIVDGKRKIYSIVSPLKKLVRKIRNFNTVE